MTHRENLLVELVDPDGTAIGSTTVLRAHEAPGTLHRAFSVFLRDPSGRVLLQQRSAAKTRFPLRWGNTCCGHPAPGQSVAAAAEVRIGEELGVTASALSSTLSEVGVHSYFAEDPVTGRVEREYDHVLVADVPDGMEFRPDPGEVARLLWVAPEDLPGRISADPLSYAPWLEGVVSVYSSDFAVHPLPDSSRSERSGGR
ncbi:MULTISPECIES: isopentenyl-diphosphate Delta-isomerase [Actinoplanes]|uniref:isopentenyl-diphosphate Delta-isomerase n=1 Tax=Actinoplanes TaxID=1865 RepID=UPI0005F2F271|nr:MULTISPECIES: isopentenyl-diphosphate Delta-isomerase [Actinoplanes]GLY07176.1 isopentenyl-diphosphate Delta-isomerase [Actinoplanes sp. NBRC 101535]